MLLFLFLAPNMMLWAQELNGKFSWTTQLFLHEQKENALHPERAARKAQAQTRRTPGGKTLKQHRLIASPDTVGGVVYIPCFLHLKDASTLSEVQALGVQVEEDFDGLDFITARVPVEQLEALAAIDNVTNIKVAKRMRILTDEARVQTNVDDVLTQSPDALAVGVTEKYDGTGVVLGIIDTGIDFQHIAFKDKDGNSRIKRAYVYTSSGKEYSTITSSAPTTDTNAEDHGTHTSTTAGGSSVIVNGSTVTVTDDHANATFGGMAPGADLYLAGIKDLNDTGLTNALKKMVTYADSEGKPLVVSNSWGSGWGPRDGTGEFADLVGQYFGDSHPNHIILFASSNDAGHATGSEGGGFFVRKSAASSSSPLGTIIRTDGYGGDYYYGLMVCAWTSSKPNCKLHVLDKSGTIKKSWTCSSSETTSFSGLNNYYSGSLEVYIEQDNGKYNVVVYSDEGLESKNDGSYSLAIEVYPTSGSGYVNMWAGDWSYFSGHLTTSGHTWTKGTDDMCVSDEATIPNAISVGAYVSKNKVKNYQGTTSSYSSGAMGDIAYFSSYATAEQSPTGQAYPWITAPGAQIVSGVNHYHTASIDEYSYYHSDMKGDLVVNSSTNPYGVMQGTSMSTPVAAGIVALWMQAAQEVGMDLTVNDVKEIMEQTAINDSYTTTGSNASHFGKGKIDALAGIQHILGTVGGPFIKATPKSIDFGDSPFATRTYTQTLNVRGLNLEGDITATLTDANGVYSLSTTSIAQADAANGVDITITYAPQAAGTHTATITLSSSNATDAVVNLTATAKPAIPTIIAEPESLTLSAALDESTSMSFEVLSEFLEGDVTVTLNDDKDVFSINKTTITKAESEEGAVVTVSFQSAVEGTYTGSITLSSAGAEPVTITLTATSGIQTLIYEGLSGYTSNGDGTAAIDVSYQHLDYEGWDTFTKVFAGGTSNAYANGGCLKLGSSSAAGEMETGSLSFTGSGTLTFYLRQYGSDTGKLNVTVTGATADVTQFTPTEGWTLCTVNLTNATGDVTISLATSAKRAYLDEITLMSGGSGGGGDTPVPVTVPTLTVNEEGVTTTSAPVSWTACDGVTSYTLQLASDAQFSTGGSGDKTTLIENSATSTSAPAGWTYDIASASKSYLVLFSGNYVTSETFNASACTELELSLSMRTYGGVAGNSNELLVEYSTNGGATWNKAGTLSAADNAMRKKSLDLSAAVGSASVKLRFTAPGASANKGVGFQSIAVTGTQASGEGSLISSTAVSGISYTFTGLTPETTYYARVKGNADWSEIVSFTTSKDDTGVATLNAQRSAVNSAAVYDLSGRQMDKNKLSNRQMPKGVYITNGRKVVVK